MLNILSGVKNYFESYYSLKISPQLFKQIFALSKKFIPTRAFPHKAIDLLDVSCSKASLKGYKQLKMDYIYQRVSHICKLPIEIVQIDPQDHCRGILKFLHNTVVNQAEALEEISRIIKISRLETDVDKTRPEGIFLFLGAHGVGKSYVAGKIAEYLFGSSEKLRVIDLAEFTKSDDKRKLLVDNKTDPGILVYEIENHPFSVILFENIGEANSSILNFLGKVIKKGVIIDPFGKKYFLSNIIFILSLTSIGEAKIGSSIGFIKGKQVKREIIIPPKIMAVLDWVDEIIQFSPLSENDLSQITNEKMNNLVNEIKSKFNINLQIEKKVYLLIAKEALKRGEYAHSVSSYIERNIKLNLLDLITKSVKIANFKIGVKSNQIQITEK